MKSTTLGSHPGLKARRASTAFLDAYGDSAWHVRCAQILELWNWPFKGQELYTVWCIGIAGNGPHEYEVPLAVLWAYLDFRYFRCPFHPA